MFHEYTFSCDELTMIPPEPTAADIVAVSRNNDTSNIFFHTIFFPFIVYIVNRWVYLIEK